MALARWNAAAIDDAGNKMDGCSVEVRRESDNGLASVYSDRAGTISLGNPFTAADGGNIGFHVAGGAYKITATLGAVSRVWRYVAVGLNQESDVTAGDVVGPASAVDDTPMVADGTTGKLIKNKTYAAFKALLVLVKGDVGLGNADNTSDVNKPVSTAQQAAINAAVVGLLDDRGNYDASVNTFPASGGSGTAGAILKGDIWLISVAGTLGGVAVAIGDQVRALVDTPGQTASNWALSEANIVNADTIVRGPTSVTDGNPTVFNGATGKLIKELTWSAFRTAASLVIGTNVQAWAAKLDAIAAMTWAADKLMYFTSASAAATTDFTSVARTLLAQTTQALMRTTGLGLTTLGDALATAASVQAAMAALGGGHVLAASAVAVPLTGTTAETALATISIPAGAMGANGWLEVLTLWSMTNSANDKTTRVRLGGIAGTVFMEVVFTATLVLQALTKIHNRNSASSQVSWCLTAAQSFASNTNALTTGVLNTAIAQDLVLSGQLENIGESVVLEAYVVKVFYKA